MLRRKCMPKTILILGGAGYIGSHTAFFLAQSGYNVIVLDDLSTGHAEFLLFGQHIIGDLGDVSLLSSLFEENTIDGIMHFAAFAYVGESVSEPLKYYENNVAKTFTLLQTAKEYDVKNIIFSSTCATYGEPKELPLSESALQSPINPYGRSKLTVEWMLEDFSKAYGMSYTALRYFNAAGALPASPDIALGEWHEPETHLIPLVLQAAQDNNKCVHVFGTDYPTPDGTCIRDYIHVCDLAKAHILALQRLWAGEPSTVFNLGNGKGYSVREIISMAQKVTGSPITTVESSRRAGDPPALVADAHKACSELGWVPQYADLETILLTAWQWEEKRKTLFPS